VLAIVALVLGGGHHGWDFWWVVPVGLLLARRLAGPRRVHREPERN
jgi:hypothetical protein